jgi:hypothetical protein
MQNYLNSTNAAGTIVTPSEKLSFVKEYPDTFVPQMDRALLELPFLVAPCALDCFRDVTVTRNVDGGEL